MKRPCQTVSSLTCEIQSTQQFAFIFFILFILMMAHCFNWFTGQAKVKAPWPGGKTYRCNQGNFGPYSHDTRYTFYSWDFNLPFGSPVLAATDGIACFAGCVGNDGYGNQLRIKHQNGIYALYAHLNEICVSVGDSVHQGQRIAYCGSTGNVTGPHLHFSFIDKNDNSLPSEFWDIGIPEEGLYYTSQNGYR